MTNKYEILSPETTYHVYNRANGSERLFLSKENYRYFLQKYQEYISPVADTFCYCLMPNHFHFLLRVKSEEHLAAIFKASEKPQLTGFETLSAVEKEKAISKYLSSQFSNLFNAYTQAFNKQHARKGSLFMRPFKRKLVSDQSYLLELVRYIHLNPTEAGLCQKPGEWLHSSYRVLLNNEATFLERKETISWFEDKSNFMHVHSGIPELTDTPR